jgi:hypothetical protein
MTTADQRTRNGCDSVRFWFVLGSDRPDLEYDLAKEQTSRSGNAGPEPVVSVLLG